MSRNQPATATVPQADCITVLKSLGPKLTKSFDGDNVIPYGLAKTFSIETVSVSGIDDLSMRLKYLAPKPLRCIIRGAFKGDAAAQTLAPPTRPGQYQRVGELFDETPHHWWCADHDDFEPMLWDPVTHPEEAIRELIESEYPPEFHTASYHWQLSASAGRKPGVLKVHLWWWLGTAYTGAQIEAWVRATKMKVDIVTLRKIQVHYTANPIFLNGTPDPMAGRRCGLHRGETEAVPLIIPQEVLDASDQRTHSGGDLDLTDPTTKPGVIGAFCKAYPISRVIAEILPDLFVYADGSDRRVTWFGGGGAVEGCYVTDDDWYLGNSHNTSPHGDRLQNAWDVVRLYKFRHLDDALTLDEQVLAGIGDLPSQQAMVAWAEALPEIKGTTAATVASDPEEEFIQALVGLSEIEYQRKREGTAKELGLGVGALDKVVNAARRALAAKIRAGDEDDSSDRGRIFESLDPWDRCVTGAEALDDTLALLHKYVVADGPTLHAAALWAALTWFADHASVLPLAVINSPEKNCGKTTFLGLIQRLALRPVSASNITAPALFRTIEAWQPTLLLDEADTFANDNEELRGILNSGHTRKSAFVIRVVEIDGEFEPQQFCTWGPKALAGIGNLPATLMSRAVVLKMRRKLAGETVANLRHAHDDEFIPAKRKLLRWSTEQGAAFAKLRPEHPALSNRDADNWEPLLALAHLAGGEWPKRANLAAVALTDGAEDSQGISEELLTDIQMVLAAHEAKNISTTELLNKLCNDDEARWATFNRGRPLTPRQLAKRLAAFDIKPRTVRDGFVNAKGYVKSAFDEVFARYLPSGG